MSIDFPPPPVPIQGALGSLKADALKAAVVVEVAGYRFHVHAPGVLADAEVLAVVADQDDVSSAIRALAAAAQRSGLLLPKTLYVRSGDDIYIGIYPGTLSSVQAPAPLKPYLQRLVSDQPLTIRAFEPRRLFAGIHADRMGAGYAPVFTPAEGMGFDLALKPGTEMVSPGSVRINLSNGGNRFTGREFLDLDARRGTAQGDEFSVLARTATKVLQLDDVEPGSDYQEAQLGWSRVTPFGLFGLASRYVDYRQQVQGFGFNGELWTSELAYTGVLLSSATQRLTVQGRADYTYKRLLLDGNGQRLQQEPYPSLEAAIAWGTSFRFIGLGWISQATLSARRGLGSVGSEFTRADLDYTLLRPSYSLRTQGTPITAELQLGGQYANVTVPEQQQWIVGGVGNLQAYVPGVAIGDRGVIARVTAEYGGLKFNDFSLKPKLFAEFGAAEYSEPVAGLPDGVQSVADVGAELVFGYRRFVETAFVAAIPIHSGGIARQPRDDARADLFFRLTGRF